MKNIGLLIVDVQNGFSSPAWGRRDSPEAESNISRLLSFFRQKNRPIYHVQHLSTNPTSPLRPGQSGVEFTDAVKPAYGERIFQKNVNSSFIGTQLKEILRLEGIQSLVIVGISVDHCVSTTARMAANLGFEVFVISDATVAHERRGYDGSLYKAELVHEVTLASLHGEFATVLSTTEIMDSLGQKI